MILPNAVEQVGWCDTLTEQGRDVCGWIVTVTARVILCDISMPKTAVCQVVDS